MFYKILYSGGYNNGLLGHRSNSEDDYVTKDSKWGNTEK
jgi:hypothetical protein